MTACSPNIIADIMSVLSDIAPCAKLLDLGCGHGETLAALAGQTQLVLYGAEPDAQRCTAARIACPQAKIVTASAEKLPYADQYFDVVNCECVLSLTDISLAAAELFRVLRAGGRLILSDLYTRSERSTLLENGDLVRAVYTQRQMEQRLLWAGFSLFAFQDRTNALKELLLQAVFDGSLRCNDPDYGALQQAKLGYGIWSFVRP